MNAAEEAEAEESYERLISNIHDRLDLKQLMKESRWRRSWT